MMKKFKRIVSLLLIIAILACLLTACTTTLNGTYVNEEGLIKQSFTFKEDNKVEVSALGLNIEGEYEIEDNTIIITYSILSIDYNMEKSFVKKGNSIFIDGVEYIKEK